MPSCLPQNWVCVQQVTALTEVQGAGTSAGASSAAVPWVCLRSTITGELQGKIISKVCK